MSLPALFPKSSFQSMDATRKETNQKRGGRISPSNPSIISNRYTRVVDPSTQLERKERWGRGREKRGESALVRPVHSRFAFLQARAPRRGRGYPMAQRLTSGLPRTLLARTPFFSPPSSSPLPVSPFIPAKSPSPFTVPLHCPLAISFRLFERTPLATTSKSTAARTTHRPFKRSTADP